MFLHIFVPTPVMESDLSLVLLRRPAVEDRLRQHDRPRFAVNESVPKSQPCWVAHTRLGNLGKNPLPAPLDDSSQGVVGTFPNYIYQNSENGIWAHPKEKSRLRPCWLPFLHVFSITITCNGTQPSKSKFTGK